MARNALIYSDNLKRARVKRAEFYSYILKICINDLRLVKKFRIYVTIRLREFLIFRGKAYKSLVRNRCIASGRARGINCYFRLARFQFRKLALKGILLGLQKFSW
jgi:small subunit ribosomal protein S14